MNSYHITDGGVYDNLGTEAVFEKLGEKLKSEINYLIVSDAGSTLDIKDVGNLFHTKLKRDIGIISDQISSLRLRIIFRYFNEKSNTGFIVKIGRTTKQLLLESEKIENKNKIEINVDEHLNKEQVKIASNYPTDLKIVTKENFYLIMRHGYENTKLQFNLYYLNPL
jgi:hypothetical protein